MKKILTSLLTLALSICMVATLAPTAFAAGETVQFSYEFDKPSYTVGDTVKVDVIAKRTDSDEGFMMYAYSLDAGFKKDYLHFVGSEKKATDAMVIADKQTYGNTVYDFVSLQYNFFASNNQPVSCENKTVIATLTFTAEKNINGTVMTHYRPDIYLAPAVKTEPDCVDATIVIGDPAQPTYSIIFNRGDAPADSVADPTKDAQAEGNTFTLPDIPYTWKDHTFLGWSDGEQTYQPSDSYKMPNHAVTFTAQWQAEKYSVTFNGGEGTTGEASTATQWKYGDEVSMYTQGSLKKDGYNFKGWAYDGKTYASGDKFKLDDRTVTSVTFTAVWEKIDTPTPSPGGSGSGSGGVTSYPVTVNSPANGTVAADKKSAASGATVTITVTPETGYKVGTVTVKDKNGKTIAATEKDGKYSFQMPASAVSVDVTFVKDGQSSVGDCPKDSTCPVDPFKDTANNAWWHDGIHYCVQQGLMNGVASDQFAPNGTTTRAMIVTILWRMEGSPATSYGMSFTDVPAGQWYTEAIRWAQSTGVVTGYDAKTFGPNDNVTREQLAAILYRYTAHKGGDVSKRSTLAQFTDVNQISSWALENIQWANAVGMVNGRTDTTIVPKGNATRAEAASMIQRFCQNVLKL